MRFQALAALSFLLLTATSGCSIRNASATPATVPQPWHYTQVLACERAGAAGTQSGPMTATLQHHGQQGWELVSLVPQDNGCYLLTFKRR
jgi:hypothetical protein